MTIECARAGMAHRQRAAAGMAAVGSWPRRRLLFLIGFSVPWWAEARPGDLL